MRRLTEWKAADGSTLKLNSNSTTSSSTQQKFEDFTDLYIQLTEKIKKIWGCSVIRCAAHVLELRLRAGVFNRDLLIQYDSKQKTFTVTITDSMTKEQIDSATCYKGFISVLLFLFRNGIIRDTKLEESTDFAAEFKLYENLFETANLKEFKTITTKQLPDILYMIYADYDNGDYDIFYVDNNLNTAKEHFYKKAFDFMYNGTDVNQKLIFVKIDVTKTQDKDFLSLLYKFSSEIFPGELTEEENKLMSKYSNDFEQSEFSTELARCNDVDAFSEALSKGIEDMTDEEWENYLNSYIKNTFSYI